MGSSHQGASLGSFVALHLAASYNDTGSILVLLDAGAQIDIQTDAHGSSALLLATMVSPRSNLQETQQIEAIEALLDGGAKTELQDSDGNTALAWAAAKGKTRPLQVLLDHGAKGAAQAHELAEAAGPARADVAVKLRQYLFTRSIMTAAARSE